VVFTKEKFRLALDNIVDTLKNTPETTGVLFFGSVQRGDEKDNSDIDLYAVVSCNECWNYKKYISGVLTEVYFAPADKWKESIENGHVITIKAFAGGTVLFERDNEVSELIELAKRQWENGPKPLTPIQINNWRIKLTEYIQDIECLPEDGYQCRLLCGIAVPSALEAFCALNGIWPEKPERIIDCIGKYDAKLSRMAREFYESNERGISWAIKIIDHVIQPFGGRLIEYEGPRISS